MNECHHSATAIIIRAVNFAAIKHKDQRRKDPERTPYINHPLGVANILSAEGGIDDPTTLTAAILHDTVEDTKTTFEEIERNFGAEVRSVVEEVTDDKSLPYEVRKTLQVESAPGKSSRAKLVKLADKLYNLRDLERSTPTGWTAHRVRQYFHWAHAVVNGLRGTNKDIEDKLDEVFRRNGV